MEITNEEFTRTIARIVEEIGAQGVIDCLIECLLTEDYLRFTKVEAKSLILQCVNES